VLHMNGEAFGGIVCTVMIGMVYVDRLQMCLWCGVCVYVFAVAVLYCTVMCSECTHFRLLCCEPGECWIALNRLCDVLHLLLDCRRDVASLTITAVAVSMLR